MTSRKLIIRLLASMVMRNPLLLKMRHISFLMFSVSLGVALVLLLHRTQIPRPSGQALSQRSQAKQNLQPKHHQD